jgi:hypothetical protein
MTALTVYKTQVLATTVATCLELLDTAPASETSIAPIAFTKNVTGWGILNETGSLAAFTAGASEPDPNSRGQLWDVTTLEGQTMLAGDYVASNRYRTNTGTITGTTFARIWKRSAAGVFTLIAKYSMASTYTNVQKVQAGPWTTVQTGPATTFAAGDKLYIDFVLNATSVSATLNLTSFRNGGALESTITPGYVETPPAGPVRDVTLRTGPLSPSRWSTGPLSPSRWSTGPLSPSRWSTGPLSD